MNKLTLINALLLVKTYRLNGDFCTNFPDKIGSHSIKLACKLHDIQYTNRFRLTFKDLKMLEDAKREHVEFREEGDDYLYDDVKLMSHSAIAMIMWVGVKFFGKRYWRK